MDSYKKSLKDTIEICNLAINNIGREGITPELATEAREIKARTLEEIRQAYNKATSEDIKTLQEWETLINNIERMEPPEGAENNKK